MTTTMGRLSAAYAHLTETLATLTRGVEALAPALEHAATGRRHGVAPGRQVLDIMRIDRRGLRSYGYTRAP